MGRGRLVAICIAESVRFSFPIDPRELKRSLARQWDVVRLISSPRLNDACKPFHRLCFPNLPRSSERGSRTRGQLTAKGRHVDSLIQSRSVSDEGWSFVRCDCFEYKLLMKRLMEGEMAKRGGMNDASEWQVTVRNRDLAHDVIIYPVLGNYTPQPLRRRVRTCIVSVVASRNGTLQLPLVETCED